MAENTTPWELLRSYTTSMWFPLARALVILYAIFQLFVALLGIILFPSYLQENLDTYTVNGQWTASQMYVALHELGWPLDTVAWVDLGRDIVSLMITYLLAFILLRKKSSDGFHLLLVLVFVLFGQNTGTAMEPALQFSPLMHQFFNDIIGAVSWQLFFIIFFLFPDGHPAPSWIHWIIRLWLGYMVITQAFPSLMYLPVVREITGGFAFLFVFSAIGSQVYRQLRQSSPVQKQQMKWVVAALVLSMVIMIPASAFAFKPPSPESLGRDLMMALMFQLLLSFTSMMIVSSILIAILRYRLYDIDVIIRRTLIYGALSVLLGMTYLGGVTVLQTFFSSVSGQSSPFIIVLSTLAIAALFNPLRHRLQEFIDRRFYRQKYNAELAIAQFASLASRETDLMALSRQLISLVKDTMQPEHASLWLRTNPVPLVRSTVLGVDKERVA